MDGLETLAASAVPLTGGYQGQTFAVTAGGEDAVLKLYVKDPERAVVDAALLQLVRGLLPVPRILDLKREGSWEDPPYLLMERLPGVNLQVYLETAGPEERRKVGTQLGELLVRLSGMPFLTAGMFRGGDLTIEPLGSADLEEYAAGLGVTRDGLPQVFAQAEELLDSAGSRFCLVHSDFNPKNLLVDPDTARITGLIDWEFAYAGSPYADLGNLLRFETDQVLAGAVLSAVRGSGLGLPEPLVELGRAADLWALLELASRAVENPVAAVAAALIARMAGTQELSGDRPDLEAI
ncbi:phosphotransferase [Kribbella sp. NBC_01505]|uniref:phosphotransferase family protein n=1 Tax=Kribbella sp. NBC_01505 TaxID=2903580 RepID=UPI003867031B